MDVDNIAEVVDKSKEALERTINGLTWKEALIALSIILGFYIFKRLVFTALLAKIKSSDRASRRFYGQLLISTESALSFLIVLTGTFVALEYLPLSKSLDKFVTESFKLLCFVSVLWLFTGLIFGALNSAASKKKENGSVLVGYLPMLKKTIAFIVFATGALIIFSNMGYNITGAIATLGVGGVAIAIASKDSLSNLFGSLSILLDRPFRIGDWIEVNGKLNGVVLSVGFRSTQVRTVHASLLTIPNSVLANEVINNWGLMRKRRVTQNVGVMYSSTAEQVKNIRKQIYDFLESDPEINQERIIVRLQEFGASSLDIHIDYFTKPTNYAPYLEVKERVNFKIMEIVEANGASFAFPSQSVYFENKLKVDGENQ